jgi:hypothetical protein
MDLHDNKPTVTIVVLGGVVHDVDCPDGVRAVVKDYDVDGCDETDLSTDANGDKYLESVWE